MGLFDLDFDPITGEKKKPKKKTGRDKRRAFTTTQKNEILHQQNNKCAGCKKKLDPRDKHFHHARAWADGGKTVVKNGRVVCGSCHNIITHKENLKKVDKKKSESKVTVTDLLGRKKRIPKSKARQVN